MSGARHFGGLRGDDMERIVRLQRRLQASSGTETIRRLSIFAETLLEHQAQTGAEIVLCRRGQPDRVVWIL